MDREFLSNFLSEKSEFTAKAILQDTSIDNDKFYWFNTAYAIAKAEYSQLTEEEALKIYERYSKEKNNRDDYVDEIKPDCLELKEELMRNKYNKRAKKKLIKYHDSLEFFNILKTIEFVMYERKEELLKSVLEEGIALELLQEIHTMLTDGLDELFLDANIPHYSPYFSGEVRKMNNIRVGNSRVMDAIEIPTSLKEINDLSRNVKNVFDIYEIHGKMYNTHIFSNGNKRVSRIIEQLLLAVYNFNYGIPTTYGYYLFDKYYINALVRYTLERKDFHEWANFAYNSSLIAVLDSLYQLIKNVIELNIISKGMNDDMKYLPLKYNFRRRDIELLFDKKWRISVETEEKINSLLVEGLRCGLIEEIKEDDREVFYQYVFSLSDDFTHEIYRQYISVFSILRKIGFSYIAQFPQYIIGEELKYL